MPEVTLAPHFGRFVEAQVRSGRFQSASEVIQAGLRLLEEETRQNWSLTDEVNQAFEETGADIPAEDVFAELERRFADDTKANVGA